MIRYEWSRDSYAASIYYAFFQENPHKPHRPYLFTRFDSMFSRKDQDDQQVLANHQENILRLWRKRKDIVDRAIKKGMSVKNLLVLEQLMRGFNPKHVIMFDTEERYRDIEDK